MDDLPIVGTSKADILQFVNDIQQDFPTKHLGELEYFLGLGSTEIEDLALYLYLLVDIILHKYDMMACSPIATPLTIPCHLSTSDSPYTNE